MKKTTFKIPVHTRITPPRKVDLFFLRILLIGGMVLMVQFLGWYLRGEHIGYSPLFWLLTLSLGYKISYILYEWFYLASITRSPERKGQREWKVDMLTTYVPGEPKEMVIETLKAMVAVRYPHTTYLCDEGNDPYLKRKCEELGVVHVYRGPDKTGAKAGNINYTLQKVASGEICVILDPDHMPVPEFLDRVLPHFEDPEIGFVQCIQGYGNTNETFVSRGAAEQTFSFYGPLMMGMQRWGTVQAIGANCTFRRAALDEIGGHAAGLCEDMHTSMRIHAKKWTSVYLPELLTRGRVPSCLSAYYHQQLKWARGSFELLFRVYPRLFPHWTWARRLHYLFTPLFFFYGVVGLIDIGVPLFSLFTYQVPLFIYFSEFVWKVLPLLAGIVIIRLYAQRYMLERNENGFHFFGGVLRVGTWWVYLIGFIYALLGIKVPYIPTSKAGKTRNEWRVSLPNLTIISLSIIAIFYGLGRDWNPFSLLMSGFVLANILLLGTTILIGQNQLTGSLLNSLKDGRLLPFNRAWFYFRHLVLYRAIRNRLVLSFFLMYATGVTCQFFFGDHPRFVRWKTDLADNRDLLLPSLLSGQEKEPEKIQTGGNQVRLYLPVTSDFTIFKITGVDKDTPSALRRILAHAQNQRTIPLIRWDLSDLPAKTETGTPVPATTLDSLAELVRKYQHSVLLLLEAQDHRRLVQWNEIFSAVFFEHGATNLSWVREYRRGELFSLTNDDPADMLLVDLQRAEALGTIAQLDRDSLLRPVLLGVDVNRRIDLPAGHPKGESGAFARIVAQVNLSALQPVSLLLPDDSFREMPGSEDEGPEKMSTGMANLDQRSSTADGQKEGVMPSPFQRGQQWIVDGQPFYVKGIHYNLEEEWRDDHRPLTRRQLDLDFSRIAGMGGNTISREVPTVYDKNILRVANEYDLKVLYGFYFDPSIDYLKDTVRVASLEREVLEKVKQFRDYPALLAWKLGNRTWNAVADHFPPPYLAEARLAYLRVVNRLAQQIKQMDPAHAVLIAVDGDDRLWGAAEDIEYAAPALDVIAVNGFDEDILQKLNERLNSNQLSRPVLITSFGGFGAIRWGERVRMIEPSCYEKARSYARVWRRHIEGNRLHNLGGVAFCWQDRRQNTATLAGLTDYRGRLKPAYSALKEVWTGESQQFPLADLQIHSDWSLDQGNEYALRYAKALEPTITAEWTICEVETMRPVKTKKIQLPGPPTALFHYREKIDRYRKKILKKLFGLQEELKAHSTNELGITYQPQPEGAVPRQRLYLYLYDENGYVVTASVPVYFQNESQ